MNTSTLYPSASRFTDICFLGILYVLETRDLTNSNSCFRHLSPARIAIFRILSIILEHIPGLSFGASCIFVLLHPFLEFFIVRQFVLLEGRERFRHLVAQGHSVFLPLAIVPQPQFPATFLLPVCLDLLLASWVYREGVLLGVGKVLDLLDFLGSAAGGGPR